MTHRMTLKARVLAALAVVLVALAGCASTPDSSDSPFGLTRYSGDERVPIGTVSGPTLTGGSLNLSSLRGKVVVLNAWASWCEPCKEELPALNAAAVASDPEQVAFVGLDVSDTASAAQAMVQRLGVTYPSIQDPEGSLLAQIPGVPPEAVPSTVVLDRQGRVAARVIGTVKPGMLEPVLAELIAESSPRA